MTLAKLLMVEPWKVPGSGFRYISYKLFHYTPDENILDILAEKILEACGI